MVPVLFYLLGNLVKDIHCFLRGCLQGFIIPGILMKIGYHENGIFSSFLHLRQIHFYILMALSEIESFGELHRCVAMGIHDEAVPVYFFGFLKQGGLVHEIIE